MTENMNAIPFNINHDRRLIRLVRQLRNLTLADMEEVMGVSLATIGQLERGTLDFSMLYQSKFDEALKKLNISPVEMASLALILELKKGNGND